MASGPTSQIGDWQTVEHPAVNDWQPVEAQQPSRTGQVLQGAEDVISGLWKTVTRSEQQKEAEDAIKGGNYGHAALAILKASLPGYDTIVKPAIDQATKAFQYAKAGRYAEAGSSALAAALPGVGPTVAGIAKTAAGEAEEPPGAQVNPAAPPAPYRALGQAAMTGALAGAPAVVKGMPLAPRIEPTLTPEATSAVQFADTQGIPISAATRTGSKFLANVQKLAQNQPMAGGIAERAQAATRGALSQTAEQMAGQVHPAAATPESAGTDVSEALQTLSKEQQRGASEAYGKLATIEADPRHIQTVQIGQAVKPESIQALDKIADSTVAKGTKYVELTPPQKVTADQIAAKMGVNTTPQPITKAVALPVDMGPAIDQLKPVLAQIKQQMPLFQQQNSRGLLAIDNIVNGDRFQPASMADQNLSALKQLQRENLNPSTMRLANQAVSAVAPLVDKAVAAAGPEATEALNEGRALTKAKYATDETFNQLPVEPVRLFDKLTAGRDININLARDVAAKAPDSIPAMGRALLEGLFEKATNAEGKPGPATASSLWDKLGAGTKGILYPDPALQGRLNDFFTLAKKVAENPNPSGTASVLSTVITMSEGGLMMHNPVLGGAAMLAWPAVTKLLYSAGGAKLLMNGLRLPITSTAAKGLAASITAATGAGNIAQPQPAQ